MLKSILVGCVLTMLTIVIHGLGTVLWTKFLVRRQQEIEHRTSEMLQILCSTALVLLLIQIIEVALWASAWLMVPEVPELSALEEALYFSMVTFTSLGYGDIVIAGPWRLLAGIQAMNGLLIFGWSTALLFAVTAQMLRRRFGIQAATDETTTINRKPPPG